MGIEFVLKPGNDGTVRVQLADEYRNDSLLMQKALLGLYPRLHVSCPQLLMDALSNNTPPSLRRIVHLYCGDGLLSNWLSLQFPEIEIIGIDPNAENIAKAQATLGKRHNLSFQLGNPNTMPEIPCDRILYSRPLSRVGNVMAFKKMFLKTSAWLVNEGDWILEESLSSMLRNPSLLKSSFWSSRTPFAILKEALEQIGYIDCEPLAQDTLFGFASKVALHSRVQGHPNLPELLQKAQTNLALHNPKAAHSAGLDDIFKTVQSGHHWELS